MPLSQIRELVDDAVKPTLLVVGASLWVFAFVDLLRGEAEHTHSVLAAHHLQWARHFLAKVEQVQATCLRRLVDDVPPVDKRVGAHHAS